MRGSRVVVGLVFVLVASSVARAGVTIRVPGDQPTIQGAIDAAADGDTVAVASGTYLEHPVIVKAVTVRSVNGAATTIIDGGGKGSVVSMAAPSGAALIGFTIRNGLGDFAYGGGGVSVSGAGTIANNIITDNAGCDGVGMVIIGGAPIVQHNVITNNQRTTCSGGAGGAGILVIQTSSAQILDNTITHNTTTADGGAISLFAAGAVTIRGNLISDNTAGEGGAIAMVNASPALIADNIIVNNHAGNGGGIAALVASGNPGPQIINNTLAGNTAVSTGTQLYIDGFKDQTQIWNNLFIDASSKVAVACTLLRDSSPPVLRNNDTYNPTGTTYDGGCASTTGSNGNVSRDPLFFADGTDFHLRPSSPARDAGANTAPGLPTYDFVGAPRVVDGDRDGVATVDIGAYEASGVLELAFSPRSLEFSSQRVGSTSAAQTVTVTNTGIGLVAIASIAVAGGEFALSSTCGTTLDVAQSCTLSVTFAPAAAGTRTGSITVTDNTPSSPHTLVLTGAASDFALEAAAGGSTSATLDAHATAAYQLEAAALGDFHAQVALTCDGAPSGTTCKLSPATVRLDGTTAPLTVSIEPAASTAGVISAPPSRRLPAALFAAALLAALAHRAARTPRRRRFTLASACGGLLGAGLVLAGCGDSGHGSRPGPDAGVGVDAGVDAGPDAGIDAPPDAAPSIPSGTYQLTITGAASDITHTLALTLTVP